MDLENITLGERIHSQKTILYDSIYMKRPEEENL